MIVMIQDDDLKKLKKLELDALILDRQAVIAVVSLLRTYRQAFDTMSRRKWGDGTIDGATFYEMEQDLDTAIADHVNNEY